MVRFVKTTTAASYLDVDPSFLKKNIGSIFYEGKHFYRPSSARLLRWDLKALETWLMESHDDTKNIVDQLLA